MEKITPLAWARMLWGNEPPLYLVEILVRVVTIYVIGVVLLRMMGKRSRQQMTSFDLLIVIALGSAMGDVMFYPQVPVLYSVIVISTILVLDWLTAKLQMTSGRIYTFIVGEPRLLILEGRVLHEALDAEALRKEELFSLLRQQGIANTGQIRTGYLELSGGVGLLKYPQGEERQGEDTEPPPDALAGDDRRVAAAHRSA
ncbi:MAG: DUF421 domain-containing protein [Pseudomonadota bacterium]|nr:DUF421 domain-containing protein [Pseudomonadota bacterium]